MTEKEMRELDVWIAENAFGIEVKWDAAGAPYNAASVLHGTVISWICLYTSSASSFRAVKREIERRGWSWMATGSARQYEFAIWDHVRASGGTPAGFAPELGRAIAATEEIAGCLALKEAMERHG